MGSEIADSKPARVKWPKFCPLCGERTYDAPDDASASVVFAYDQGPIVTSQRCAWCKIIIHLGESEYADYKDSDATPYPQVYITRDSEPFPDDFCELLRDQRDHKPPMPFLGKRGER